MRVRFVEIDGLPTRCFESGPENAPPLLLLHGITLNAEIWLRNIDVLGRKFRIIAPDMLGHGFTGPIALDDRPLLKRKVDHLHRLADVLGLERFCVSGCSYGALVAILMYFSRPDRIDKLVINGSGSSFNTDEQLLANMQSTYDALNPVIAGATAEYWLNRVGQGFFDPSKVPGEIVTSLMTCYARPWAVAAWERSIRDLMDLSRLRPFRVLDRLETIGVKSLVVWGREDRGAIYESAVAAVKRMPDARLETFEQCGHFPMIEHPARYNELIRAFMESP